MATKKDFVVAFSTLVNPKPNMLVEFYEDYYHNNDLSDEEYVLSTGQTIEPAPHQNSYYRWRLVKNTIFTGPFTITNYGLAASCAFFEVKLTKDSYANIKMDEYFRLMKENKVSGMKINCDLTFKRFGSAKYLVEA